MIVVVYVINGRKNENLKKKENVNLFKTCQARLLFLSKK